MKRSSVLVIGLILGALILTTPVHARNPLNLSVEIKEFSYDQGSYRIKFGVINDNSYGRNPTIVFKVMDGGKSLVCQRLTLNVPAGSDGSALQEIVVAGPQAQGEAKVQARIFDAKSRDRVGAWMADCPQ